MRPAGAACFEPLLEPHGVHAVAGAVDVAAQQALMGLDQARLRAPHVAAGRAREAPVAPQRADVERIEDQRLDQLQARLRPRSRVQGNGDVALEQRLERPLGDALRRAFGLVVLADDREAHQGPFMAGLAGVRRRRARRRSRGVRGSPCVAKPGNDSKVRGAAARDRRRPPSATVRAYSPAGPRPAGNFAAGQRRLALPVQSIAEFHAPSRPPPPPCRSTPSMPP